MICHRSSPFVRGLVAALALIAGTPWVPSRVLRAAEETNVAALRQQAVRDAAAAVGPSVVRIETIGGLEKVGDVLTSTGPTTGLIVSPDGFIISSAFNFAQKSSSILVTLPDGSRSPARLVATDHSRMLVLLKVDVEDSLPMPEVAPPDAHRVGRWAVAVGRTFDGDSPNLSLGIISALGRVSGKALQTDAKISPANYGGPLVDIEGRVLGVLVPLSPTESGSVAGFEWYDSGIGFAIPLAHVLSVLPRMVDGQDLHPGLLGVSLGGDEENAEAPRIAECRINSPAAKGGLAAGDVIVELDGKPIERAADVKNELNRLYAGDKVRVVVLRGEERVARELELVARIDPYERPLIGLLPLRGETPPAGGVPVRYVFPTSGAAAAGLQPGDIVTSIDQQPAADAQALRVALADRKPGDTVTLGVHRGAEQLSFEVRLTPQPEFLPESLPPASAARQPAGAERPESGRVPLAVAGFKQEPLVYLPVNYDPAIPAGLVVWLRPTGQTTDDEVLARWQKLCDEYDLVLLAPAPQADGKWQPADLEFMSKAIEALRANYAIDATRLAVAGEKTGGTAAFVLAFQARDAVRAVGAIDCPLMAKLTDHEPLRPLSIYLASASQTPFAAAQTKAIAKLREMKFPVTVQPLGETPRELTADEWQAFARWLDSLDRI
ncbi:MAG: PDZ domain-containing protein [Pirellulales bacterium]|nr:PDZ domain-containing protein [Pirellulales bacterium]